MDLRQALNAARSTVQADPNHKLAPEHRRAIYDALEPAIPLPQPRQVMKKRGKLAVAAARYVLAIWDQITPIYGDNVEEQDRIDDLPSKFLNWADEVLNDTASVQTIWNLIDDEEGWISTLDDEFFEFRTYENETEKLRFHNAYYALLAAYHALLEVLGVEHLTGRTQILGTVDMKTGKLTEIPPDILATLIPENELDAAGAAAIAFAGYDHPDPQKQLIFWEWWLNEALPTVTQGEA